MAQSTLEMNERGFEKAPVSEILVLKVCNFGSQDAIPKVPIIASCNDSTCSFPDTPN